MSELPGYRPERNEEMTNVARIRVMPENCTTRSGRDLSFENGHQHHASD